MRQLRVLTSVLAALLAAWGGYWVLGARGMDRSVTAWLDARHEAGWVAEYDAVRTRGFPNRFDTTISALELADPATGLAWTGEFLQLFRLSYQRKHVIAVLPPQSVISTPRQKITVTGADTRASLVFADASNWTLERSAVAVTGLALASDAGWSTEIAELRLATRPSERAPGAVDIGLDAKALRPAGALLADLAARGIVPGDLERLSLDASVRFDAPWDLRAIEARRPAITAIDLHKAEMLWGALELWLAGEVTVDSAGRMTGSMTVKAKNWREMLALAEAAGWVPEQLVGPLESGLSLLTGLSGGRDTLDAPLTFAEGAVWLGPIRLGQAPRLLLR
ncbi:High-affinity K+ transport system, ATPase chain B [Candidatus Rhodobacter oscarellae]|uniref:High-affinity K+ transport system, ATPase chain B n=1 Tax=Candidatus Rhodobacter oscarellae TaxID=1675527 RepID=A0A0J9DZH3_9RHOB|nr:DUF2125 domain-containing protein [Candidatus Rhodobacter lobularis]KMW56086.1 High-affinity K+ transport system, ATPase chain B [Candidatus Rhodobacter lobularis]